LRIVRAWVVIGCIVLSATPLFGQQLLDRVVARVNGSAITLTDVQAAIGLGLVDVPAGSGVTTPAVQQLIDRQLLLGEVARFSPPEPDPAAVDTETAAMKKRVGARLDALIRATGLDEARIHETARDTLRIQAYLNQRFGTTLQVSDEEVDEYYRAHPGEFSRDARVIPFEEAEPVARQRAAAERRGATIAQWVRDLRSRAEITLPPQ
jgi:hypothetical protein